MLKWIKKFKEWLQGEEIIEIEEVIIDDSFEHEELEKVKHSNISTSHRRNAQLDDPETNVLYQYPKGQFKFPLIPDERLLSSRNPSERGREEKRTQVQERHRSSSSAENKKAVASEPKRKMASPKKPFRPTEIPSPIYGFQRPQKQKIEKTVEFELETKPSLTTHESEPELDVPAFFRKNKQLEELPILESTLQLTNQEEIMSTVVRDEANIDSISTVADVVDEKSIVTDLAVEENIESVEIVKLKEKEESIQADTTKEEEEKESNLQIASPTTDESRSINDDKHVVINKEEPRKKHIPFNVLMLKQDQKKQNFSSFKEIEKKTELHKTSDSENKTKASSEGKVNQQEVERPLEAKIDGMKQEYMGTDENIEEKINVQTATQMDEENPYYVFPDIELLTPPITAENDEEWLEEQTVLLDETLINFNVRARVVNVTQGPAVTRFEVYPEPGVKVNKVTNLMDDLKLSLAAQDMRMEAPIPGKHTIGIEIPNRKSKPVFLREVLESEAFQNHSSPLAVAMGLDISGQPVVTDLRKMPHGLIAGQTGSGKSVCINTMLVSLLYKATPQELKLMLIDPKMVELAPYNDIPHLVSPVITDVKAATAALKWAVEEMERRYELFVHAGVRDITKFNEHAEQAGQYANKLPYILIIIDELADLMMMSPADVEEAICRIAQKARACGIHLIVATQRPSVDVITGLIKANIPTRVAFSVSSQVDSRTIIDSGGAEKLLGRGDMLFAENGSSKTIRLQGTFVSDDEIDQVVQHVKKEQQPNYLFEQEELLNRAQVSDETDELFFEACEFVVSQQSASTSSIQRRFRVGYNRAARLIEMMEQQGIISESRGSKPREVLISEDDLEYLQETNAVQ